MSNYAEESGVAIEAFRAFKAEYSEMYPPPQYIAAKAENNLWVMISVAVLFIASVWVSASHTIPALRGSDVPDFFTDLARITMIEGSLFLIGYALVKLVTKGRDTNYGPKLNFALHLSLAVALAANLSHVLIPILQAGAEADTDISRILRLLVGTLVGASAPINGFVLGDILALLQVRTDEGEQDAKAEHDERVRQWESALADEWKRKRSRVIRVERPLAPQIPAVSNSNGIPMEFPLENTPRRSSVGHTKDPEATPKTIEYFRRNPLELQFRGEAEAERIALEIGGVGTSTVYNIRTKMRNGEIKLKPESRDE
jgi:hypothetical protein